MSVQLYLLLLSLCFVAAAFFSGTESGVLSINHARLMHLVRAKSRAAKLLNGYISDMQRFLATILIGTNLMNVVLSTLSAGLAQLLFAHSSILQAVWGTLMAFMVLFFGEYLPKLFFTTRPLRRTLMVLPVFMVAEKLLIPLTELVLFLTKWIVPKSKGGSEQRFLMTREYIQNVVSDPRDGSRITAVERLMINRVLALQALTAVQVMTPLSRVSYTTEQAMLSACFQQVRDSGHVRLPVFGEDGKKCVGVLNTLDVLYSSPDPEQAQVHDFMRPPLFVDGDVRADDVLPLMRKSRQPMAMVRSVQDGAVLGIITEENVLSALTGSL
jgi:CBS domain containing-hemolysin-like protein